MSLRSLVLAAGILFTSSSAFAVPERGLDGDPPMGEPAGRGPAHGLWYTSATFARGNPLGLISVWTLGWRGRLSTSDSVLLRDSYVHVGMIARGSPAFGRVGLHAEAQPLAILKLFADAEMVGYFGSFDQIYSGPADVVYDDRTLSEVGATTGATRGTVLTAGAVLQAAAGPIAVRSTFQITRFDLRLDGGDVAFYDQYSDRLVMDTKPVVLNDLDVMAIAGKARVGARWTYTDTLGAPEGTDGALAHHRLGPLFAWQFHDKPGARFDQPTVFVLAQGWLQHPYRTGREQAAWLPLIAAGFAFRGFVTP